MKFISHVKDMELGFKKQKHNISTYIYLQNRAYNFKDTEFDYRIDLALQGSFKILKTLKSA